MLDKPSSQKPVCPRWLCFTFDNRIRKLIHNPETILSPYVRPGDTVIDIGPGTGYFSIPLARLVGSAGHVTAIDVQNNMLAALAVRARRRGVAERIKLHLASLNSLGQHPKADFILAFWMVHEVPDQQAFLTEVFNLLKLEGRFLLVEPKIHVTAKNFLRTMQTANDIGFVAEDRPKIRLSRSVLFTRKEK